MRIQQQVSIIPLNWVLKPCKQCVLMNNVIRGCSSFLVNVSEFASQRKPTAADWDFVVWLFIWMKKETERGRNPLKNYSWPLQEAVGPWACECLKSVSPTSPWAFTRKTHSHRDTHILKQRMRPDIRLQPGPQDTSYIRVYSFSDAFMKF